jgi:Holliday junction resolvase
VIEATIKKTLVKKIRETIPGAVVFRHEDQFTHGIPDISVTVGDITLWIEVKIANPSLKKKKLKLQTEMIRRLKGVFVIFTPHYTHIADAREITDNTWRKSIWTSVNINYNFVVDYIEKRLVC